MICAKIRSTLEGLIPETAAVNSADGAIQESQEKEQQKRANGVIERDYAIHGYHLDAQLGTEQLLEAVSALDQAEFFLETITGVDWIAQNQLELIYDFSRYDFDLCRVVLRTRIDRANPVAPSITSIYPGANWHERETHDFFGIKFAGHPHLIPLLLPEDADYHPLLKDFKA
jgi:NADH-quinone oxidoreductase subunit C